MEATEKAQEKESYEFVDEGLEEYNSSVYGY